ncbi:WXG100 family type VII secretion target [Lentzea sp. NPDC059081]|uniref:WXG100 family type VII secretion target n=1 Tax=Lentzea sp. NPDC059081 TaxID=3346719 RepID=UPI0036782B6E
MGAFTTTPEELDALAKHIGDISEQIQAQARTVKGAAEGVSSAWGGMAATAFQNLMVRMDEDVRKLDQALQAIQEQIASTSQVYARNETEQEQAVTGISNRL